MKAFFYLILASFWVCLSFAEAQVPSLVRVNVTSQAYNFNLPWQKVQPSDRSGNGIVLEGSRVLVTAEMVQDATYINFENAMTGKKVTAKREFVDYEANLAVLKATEDEADFFKNLKVVMLSAKKYKQGDTLQVWQLEDNGTPVSTEISFEKAEMDAYFIENTVFLQFKATGSVQYRAGTFTAPVFDGESLVGLIMSYNRKDQVAEIIPPPMIRAFLADTVDGTYSGFPSFGLKVSPLTDEQLRRYMKLDGHEGGLFINDVIPGTSAATGGLQKGDVLLKLAGQNIDARGNYPDPDYGLLAIGHLIKTQAKVGDQVEATILRAGEVKETKITLVRKDPSQYLVDPYMIDRAPKYFILGGMVFTELTQSYLEDLVQDRGDWRDLAPFKLVHALSNPEKYEAEGRKKLVILAGMLPSESTLGYEQVSAMLVNKVNGNFIRDLNDLAEAVQKPLDGIHKVEIEDAPHTLYVDAAQAEKDNKDLLPKRYRINQLQRLK